LPIPEGTLGEVKDRERGNNQNLVKTFKEWNLTPSHSKEEWKFANGVINPGKEFKFQDPMAQEL